MTTLRQAQHLPSHLSERYSPQAPCRMKHWSWDSSNNPQGNPWAHTCILGSIYTLRKAHRNVTKFKILLGTDQCNYSVMKVKKANAPSSQCYTGKLQHPCKPRETIHVWWADCYTDPGKAAVLHGYADKLNSHQAYKEPFLFVLCHIQVLNKHRHTDWGLWLVGMVG